MTMSSGVQPRRSGSRRRIFVCLALLLAIAIVEGGVRAAFFLRGQLPPSGDPSLELEWQWAQNHLQAGTAVLPGEFDFDPTLGWRLRPGTHGKGVTTNQEGIRDEREIARTPAQGELRVALVGDSFTFGD